MSVIETKAPVAVESFETLPGNPDCRIYGGTYAEIKTFFDYDFTLSEPKHALDSKNVRKRTYHGSTFLAKITTHDKRPNKDGPAYLQGELTTGAISRSKNSMLKSSLMVLDSDTGEEETYLRQCLLDADLCGVIASSHSHLKTETFVNLKDFAKFLGVAVEDFGDEITDEQARDYILKSGKLLPKFAEDVKGGLNRTGFAGGRFV